MRSRFNKSNLRINVTCLLTGTASQDKVHGPWDSSEINWGVDIRTDLLVNQLVTDKSFMGQIIGRWQWNTGQRDTNYNLSDTRYRCLSGHNSFGVRVFSVLLIQFGVWTVMPNKILSQSTYTCVKLNPVTILLCSQIVFDIRETGRFLRNKFALKYFSTFYYCWRSSMVYLWGLHHFQQ